MKTVTMTLGVSQGVSLGDVGLHVIISIYTYVGSWTLENYQERMEQINREKLERRQRIKEYLQTQNEIPTTESEVFNFL